MDLSQLTTHRTGGVHAEADVDEAEGRLRQGLVRFRFEDCCFARPCDVIYAAGSDHGRCSARRRRYARHSRRYYGGMRSAFTSIGIRPSFDCLLGVLAGELDGELADVLGGVPGGVLAGRASALLGEVLLALLDGLQHGPGLDDFLLLCAHEEVLGVGQASLDGSAALALGALLGLLFSHFHPIS